MKIAHVGMAMGTGQVSNFSSTRNSDGDDMCVAHLPNAQAVFERAKWVNER